MPWPRRAASRHIPLSRKSLHIAVASGKRRRKSPIAAISRLPCGQGWRVGLLDADVTVPRAGLFGLQGKPKVEGGKMIPHEPLAESGVDRFSGR